MMNFIENFVHVTLFLLFVVGISSVVILAAIEAYDRLTGADAKRQAQLERLRRLEEDDV